MLSLGVSVNMWKRTDSSRRKSRAGLEQFDRIAHVFSSYESRHRPDDPKPFMRGINSIQLFHDGRRWWIVTLYWQQDPDHPIPGEYL